MAYVTKDEIKTEVSETVSGAILTDSLLDLIINRSTFKINTDLSADKNTDNEFVSFQSDDSDGDSYCTANELAMLKKACLFLACSKTYNIKSIDVGYTMNNKGENIKYNELWVDKERSNTYFDKYLDLIDTLIEGDVDGHFLGSTRTQTNQFMVTNTQEVSESEDYTGLF